MRRAHISQGDGKHILVCHNGLRLAQDGAKRNACRFKGVYPTEANGDGLAQNAFSA
jgi:hypothetical protein